MTGKMAKNNLGIFFYSEPIPTTDTVALNLNRKLEITFCHIHPHEDPDKMSASSF